MQPTQTSPASHIGQVRPELDISCSDGNKFIHRIKQDIQCRCIGANRGKSNAPTNACTIRPCNQRNEQIPRCSKAIWTNLSYYPGIDSASPFNFTNTTHTAGTITVNVSANDSAGNLALRRRHSALTHPAVQHPVTAATLSRQRNVSRLLQCQMFLHRDKPGRMHPQCQLGPTTQWNARPVLQQTMSGQSEAHTHTSYSSTILQQPHASATRTIRLTSTKPAITKSRRQTPIPDTSIDFKHHCSEASAGAATLRRRSRHPLTNSRQVVATTQYQKAHLRQSLRQMIPRHMNSTNISFTVDTDKAFCPDNPSQKVTYGSGQDLTILQRYNLDSVWYQYNGITQFYGI